MTLPRLYTYIIKIDKGAAPNPFWGVCTLVICKPKIRKHAAVGDWVAGFAPSTSPNPGALVYAMRITDKMSMADYDEYTRAELPEKIPSGSRDKRAFVGDSVYDFSNLPPSIRRSVHDESNRIKDLSGEHALLSTDFHYFGRSPIDVPDELEPIVPRVQGHRSRINDLYVESFIEWFRSLPFEPNTVHAMPNDARYDDVSPPGGDEAPKPKTSKRLRKPSPRCS